jgi:phage gp36-like protein
MAYCTVDDLLLLIPLAELAELTAEDEDLPDYTVAENAIDKAGAEIDSYLGVRYTLPLAAAPAQLRNLAADMALFHLYSRRSIAPQVRRQKYDDAVAFLKQVAAGQALVDGAGNPAEDNRQVAEFSGASRVFSRDDLSDW